MRRPPSPEVQLEYSNKNLDHTLSRLDTYSPDLAVTYISDALRSIVVYSREIIKQKEEKEAKKAAKKLAIKTPKPSISRKTQTIPDRLPAIVAILNKHDSGEYGNSSCPHCGALGRYTYHFICDDGRKYGAMAGCIKLFPKASGRHFSLLEKAFTKEEEAKTNKSKLASWWVEMLTATQEFGNDKITKEQLFSVIDTAESRRQAWLSKNGYKR